MQERRNGQFSLSVDNEVRHIGLQTCGRPGSFNFAIWRSGLRGPLWRCWRSWTGNGIWHMNQHTIWICVLCGVSGCGNLVDPLEITQAFWFWCVKRLYYYYHYWHLFMLAVWCCPFCTNRKSDKSVWEKVPETRLCDGHVMTKFSL